MDERLGINRRYSAQAQRLISLAAASWSYDISRERLEELCGLSVSDKTVHKFAQETGAKMETWQRTEPLAVQEFCQATGDIEFTSVSTIEGWREVKLGLFSKRDRAEQATNRGRCSSLIA